MRDWSRWYLVPALLVALACARNPPSAMSQVPPGTSPPAPPSESLQKLVAPIALYPDALIAQILPASTQPLQVVEAYQAIQNGQRPDQAAASQWDPSVQALLSYPTVLKMMSDKVEWTTQLGQAVVANQGTVMAAIQDVRRQAQAAGNLASNDKQVVQVEGSGTTSTIIIEPTNPQYIYVPQYNPVAILAPAPYYGYGYASPLLTFGVGFAAGAATAYACDWGHYGGYGNVTVNNSYHYNQTNNYGAYNSYHSNTANYSHYNPNTGNSAHYNPSTGTYAGYDSKTGTYGTYNSKTGKYNTYNPSTGAYNKDGSTGTYHPPSSTSSNAYHPPSSTSGYGGTHDSATHSSWDGSGGDAFHGAGGGGWGSRDASDRGSDSFGGRSFGGGGWGGGDRGFGGGGGRFGGGGGFGGFRGGGFGGRR